jgi:hypothetical protein
MVILLVPPRCGPPHSHFSLTFAFFPLYIQSAVVNFLQSLIPRGQVVGSPAWNLSLFPFFQFIPTPHWDNSVMIIAALPQNSRYLSSSHPMTFCCYLVLTVCRTLETQALGQQGPLLVHHCMCVCVCVSRFPPPVPSMVHATQKIFSKYLWLNE